MELVIKKEKPEIAFKDNYEIEEYLQKYVGHVLFYPIDDGSYKEISYYESAWVHSTVLESLEKTSVRVHDNKEFLLSRINFSHYRIFTCGSFDEAYNLMKTLETE